MSTPEMSLPVRRDRLATVEEAIARIARGQVIIMVDDPDRENEGDFVAAASLITRETINFMATHGRGLICCAVQSPQLARLQIAPMTNANGDKFGTAFHISVDHRENGTGISASDRAQTIRALADPASRPEDFRMPGHMFPLAARAGGVLERAGHTEASVDMARLAGLPAAGVICEVADDDGEMARLPRLMTLARAHDLPILAISDLIAYRQRQERRAG